MQIFFKDVAASILASLLASSDATVSMCLQDAVILCLKVEDPILKLKP